MDDRAPPVIRILGLGNELRGDDGAGPAAVRLIREPAQAAGIEVREQPGEPIGLLDAWRGCAGVVLIDAVRGDGSAGTIYRLDVSDRSLPPHTARATSTHATGLGETIELARALGRLPDRVIVLAVEGERFEAGTTLSAPLQATLPELAEAALAEAQRLAQAARPRHP